MVLLAVFMVRTIEISIPLKDSIDVEAELSKNRGRYQILPRFYRLRLTRNWAMRNLWPMPSRRW